MAKNEVSSKGNKGKGGAGGASKGASQSRGQKNNAGGRGRGKSRGGGRGGSREGAAAGPLQCQRSKEDRAAFQRNRKARITSELAELGEKKKQERVPLEESVTHARDELSGEIIAVKDLDRRWIGKLSFLEYLPSDNVSSQSHEALAYLCKDLRELLVAPYNVFWSYVLLDKSFSLFFDSFLRYFDKPTMPLPDLQRVDEDKLDAEALRGVLFQRVFLVVCRVSQMEEEPHLFMSSCFYTQEITKNHLLDLPKLIDFARLYGCWNRQKVQSTLKFLFYQIRTLSRDFRAAVSIITQELDRVIDAVFDESGTIDMQSVLGTLADLTFTLATFVEIAPNSAVYAVRDDRQLLNLLFYCFDAAAPRLESLLSGEEFEGQIEKLRRSSLSLVHAVIERCYLGPLLLGREKRNFNPASAAEDACTLVIEGSKVMQRLAILKGHTTGATSGSLLAALEKEHVISASFCKVAPLLPNLRARLDEAISALPKTDVVREDLSDVPVAVTDSWESERLPLVNSVKEILGSDIGDGFLDACLRHYNDSVELVVTHFLDGSLHDSLNALDRSLARPVAPSAVESRVVPYEIQPAESKIVAQVHYGKKSISRAEDDSVPDAVKGFAKTFAKAYAEDLLYDDEWDDSFDGQAPVRLAGDTTSDEVVNLTSEDNEDVGEAAEGPMSEDSANRSHATKFPGKGQTSTRSYAQKRNRKKLAAKKRAV